MYQKKLSLIKMNQEIHLELILSNDKFLTDISTYI